MQKMVFVIVKDIELMMPVLQNVNIVTSNVTHVSMIVLVLNVPETD